MPQASSASGRPPSEVTQSSTTSAPAARAARAIASTGCATPVEVSACTNATTRGRARAMASAMASSARIVPGSASTRVTLGSGAPGHLAHPLAEDARHPDHDRIARLEQVDQAGLHARAAGGRERQRHPVPGSEQPPQAGLHAVEHAQEGRIEMAEHRLRERSPHARMDVRGAGSEQQPARGGGGGHAGHGSGSGR